MDTLSFISATTKTMKAMLTINTCIQFTISFLTPLQHYYVKNKLFIIPQTLKNVHVRFVVRTRSMSIAIVNVKSNTLSTSMLTCMSRLPRYSTYPLSFPPVHRVVEGQDPWPLFLYLHALSFCLSLCHAFVHTKPTWWHILYNIHAITHSLTLSFYSLTPLFASTRPTPTLLVCM